MRRIVLLWIVLGWSLSSQLVLAAGYSVTVTARVPLSLTQQWLIGKNSTVKLTRPLGSASPRLTVQLAGLRGKSLPNHQLRLIILNKRQQAVATQTFSVDAGGFGVQTLPPQAEAGATAVQLWDTTFDRSFLVRELALADILNLGKVYFPVFGYEGQKTTLGAYTAGDQSGRLLAVLPRQPR